MERLNSHTAVLSELPKKIPEWLNEHATLIKAVATID
jgi:hypothetical protein